MKLYILTSVLLVSGLVQAHPVSLGRLSIQNKEQIFDLKLEVDFHSCEHLLNAAKCELNPATAKNLFNKSLGVTSLKLGGAVCAWNEDFQTKKVSREMLELSVSAKCPAPVVGNELILDLAFLKTLGSKYNLMTKSNLNGVERSQTVTPKEPSLKLKF